MDASAVAELAQRAYESGDFSAAETHALAALVGFSSESALGDSFQATFNRAAVRLLLARIRVAQVADLDGVPRLVQQADAEFVQAEALHAAEAGQPATSELADFMTICRLRCRLALASSHRLCADFEQAQQSLTDAQQLLAGVSAPIHSPLVANASAELLLEQAQLALDQGDPVGAETAVGQIPTQTKLAASTSTRRELLLAHAALGLGHAQAAYAKYDSALAQSPRSPAALLGRIEAALHFDLDLARKHLMAAQDAELVIRERLLLQLLVASEHERSGRYAAASRTAFGVTTNQDFAALSLAEQTSAIAATLWLLELGPGLIGEDEADLIEATRLAEQRARACGATELSLRLHVALARTPTQQTKPTWADTIAALIKSLHDRTLTISDRTRALAWIDLAPQLGPQHYEDAVAGLEWALAALTPTDDAGWWLLGHFELAQLWRRSRPHQALVHAVIAALGTATIGSRQQTSWHRECWRRLYLASPADLALTLADESGLTAVGVDLLTWLRLGGVAEVNQEADTATLLYTASPPLFHEPGKELFAELPTELAAVLPYPIYADASPDPGLPRCGLVPLAVPGETLGADSGG